MTWIDQRIGISMAERGVPGGVLMVIRVLAGDTLANHTSATSVAYPPLAFLLKASAKSHSLIGEGFCLLSNTLGNNLGPQKVLLV